MKKFLGAILVLVCFITPAFAEPVSQEVLNQARTQAGLFMDLKNALDLEWLDEYNAYLANPTSSPKPSWASSVTELINKNYLSTAFPNDFTIAPTGQEVTISRIITSQGIKDALPIYLPAVTISGDTVSLLVQRPAQWVAWEDALASKVSRAGDDNPDILPGASLEFGSGSKIEFINNDGKLVGINSLTYKGQELEDRFVNAAGDNMTGPLKINGNIVWHAGNDGSGSGLDADLLDGKDSSHFTNASNLISGTVPTGRLTGTYNISISGNAATATNANYASSAGNADTVDGKHASDFALSGHTHGQYVQKTGDTMTGKLTAPQFQGNIFIPDTRNNAINPGDLKSESRIDFKFANILEIPLPKGVYYTTITMRPWQDDTGGPAHQIALGDGDDIRYRTGTQSSGWSSWNKVWHAGNDGTGSGLDADLLDSKDSSFFTNAGNLSSGIVPVARLSGTYDINILRNAATATKLATARTISLTGDASGSASFDGSSNISINTNVSYSSNSDKLDGYHADSFIKKSGDTATGPIYFQGGLSAEAQTKDDITTRTPSGFWQTNSATTGEGWPQTTNTWYHLLSSTHSNTGNYYAMQFAGNFHNSNDIYYRSTAGSGTTPWNKIWHSGNDGTGSGLDADLLDGQHGAFYQNASNLNAGTVPTGRLSGTYNISISGNAATATNADRLDGYHHDAFVKRAGDTMTGNLTLQGTSINIQRPETSGGYARGIMFYSKDGSTVEAGIGMLGSGNNPPQTLYMGFGTSPWNSSAGLTVTPTNITFKDNKVWHAGNDGSGSGLDADLLDGKHASAFALAHDHPYVKKAGDTMTGTLTAPGYQINDANTKIGEGSNNSVRIQTNYGYVDIGPQNTGWVHFNTDRPEFYFNKPVEATNMLKVYNTGTYLTGAEGKIAGNTVWHAGNDGSGSGLDADLLDGKHWSDIKSYIDSGSGYQPNGRTVFISSGTWTKKSGTKFVMVYVWGGGGGGGGRGLPWVVPSVTGGNGGTSSFGSYCSATGGKGGSGTAGGAGGTGSGGDVNLSGKTGGAPSGENGGAGGRPARENGFSAGVGGFGTFSAYPAYGGGGGGYAEKWIDVQSISSVYVTVGAGGVGAVVDGIDRAGSGKPGLVIVEEYK